MVRYTERLFVAFMAVTCGCFVVSCGHDSPQDTTLTNGGVTAPDSDDNPHGNGNRPGIGELDHFEKELKDDVLRVKGGGVNLRYDRGGVLFTSGNDGSVRVVDLDGADEVHITTGTEGTDSVMAGATLTVNGRNVSLTVMKKMRLSEGRIWYRAADTAGDDWVMVLPL